MFFSCFIAARVYIYLFSVYSTLDVKLWPNHQGLFNGTLNVENGNPHGFGSIRYLKGDRFNRFNYTGQWRNSNIAEGGIIVWNNGARSVQDAHI